MVEAENLRLEAGFGILDDVNADVFSPRQVLLVVDAVYQQFGLPPASLRENLRVRGQELTRLKSGHLLQIGESVVLRLTLPCEPCAKLNRVRSGLAKDIADHRGSLARVIRGGTIKPGDALVILDETLPTLPQQISERVYHYLQAVPRGSVVTFSQITRSIGVTKSYARVMPRILRSAPEYVPAHRVLSTARMLIEKHILGQRQILAREGVPISEQGVVDNRFVWDSSHYLADERDWLRPVMT